EKQLRVFALCDLRDKNGAADIPTVLIKAERRWTKILRGERAMIARPVVRVERRIAKILDQIAMEIQRAAFRYETDLAARGSAILGSIVGRQDLHLLNRVDVERSEHRTGRARARRDCAIHHHDVFV